MIFRRFSLLVIFISMFGVYASGNNPAQANLERRSKTIAGKKLFPQITDGIYNATGDLVMNCQIAPDGLTVTDLAWNTYLPSEGKGKRWKFNQAPNNGGPLINYQFNKKLSPAWFHASAPGLHSVQ